MRWCVSIGAVLVAGAMAGGDVAGMAAPGPGNRCGGRAEAVGRCRVDSRGGCFLLDGSRRTRRAARGLRTGHQLEGIPAGAEKRADRQDRGDLFRMGGVERPEDHHSLARDRRSGIGGRRRARDPEGADPPGVAHLDLRGDQFRGAAVRREPEPRAAAGHRYFRRRRQQQWRAGHRCARCGARQGHRHQRAADHGEGAVLFDDGHRQSRFLLRGLRHRRTGLLRGVDQGSRKIQGGDPQQAAARSRRPAARARGSCRWPRRSRASPA